jgi:hypothetical protein
VSIERWDRRRPQHASGVPVLGTVQAVPGALDVLAAALWLVLAGAYLAQGRQIVLADLRDPVLSPFVSSLEKLAGRQALELSPTRFRSDINHLLTTLDRVLSETQDRVPADNLDRTPAGNEVFIPIAGILDVPDSQGHAFVRTTSYLAGPNDVSVSLSLVREHDLRKGDVIEGAVRKRREDERREKLAAPVRLDRSTASTLSACRPARTSPSWRRCTRRKGFD